MAVVKFCTYDEPPMLIDGKKRTLLIGWREERGVKTHTLLLCGTSNSYYLTFVEIPKVE